MNEICNALKEQSKEPVLKCIITQTQSSGADELKIHQCVTHAKSIMSNRHSRNGLQEIVTTFNKQGCRVSVEDVYAAQIISEEEHKQKYWWIK